MTKVKIAIFSVITFIIIYGTFRIIFYDYVKPDEIGVWMTNGGNNGISDYEPYQGTFPIDFNPLTKAFKLPAQPWTIDCSPDAQIWKTYYSAQKGEWTVDPQFTFLIDRNQAPLVCFRNNSMLKENTRELKEKFLESVGRHLLMPIINDVCTEVIATRSDSVLMTNTYQFQRMLEDSVRVRFKRVGYILETFVSNLNPPSSIIAKNRAKNEAEAAALTAKADVIKAEAEAKVLLANAKAQSEAMLVTERANAEAYALRARSITQTTIQQEWIAKWNGELPTYWTGQQTFPMFNFK